MRKARFIGRKILCDACFRRAGMTFHCWRRKKAKGNPNKA